MIFLLVPFFRAWCFLLSVSCEERLSSPSLCSFMVCTTTVGPQECKVMGGSVPMFMPIQHMLLCHHNPTGITANLMRKLLNPNVSIAYHSLLSFVCFSCWSYHFTWVNFLILLVLFNSSMFCFLVCFFILSHSILNLLPLYLKGNSCFSYSLSPTLETS